jgi:hypothetical protein
MALTLTVHIDGLPDKTATIQAPKIIELAESMGLFRDNFPSDAAYGKAVQDAIFLFLGSLIREKRRNANLKSLEDTYLAEKKQARREVIDVSDIITVS